MVRFKILASAVPLIVAAVFARGGLPDSAGRKAQAGEIAGEVH
jgi:hypothetical protein